MARFKRILGIFGTIGFGILLAIVMLEVIGRVLHLLPSPLPQSYQTIREVVGRFPEPYSYFWFDREDGERIWVQFNAHSLRDIDHQYDIPDEKTRIMFLGDSFTAGWQVPLAETYTGRLRGWLPNDAYDFINAGLHGWGTDRQYLYYHADGYRYDSDVVVLQIYVGNDILDNGIAVLENRVLDDGRRIVSYDVARERPTFTLDETGELVFNAPRWLPPTRIETVGGIRSWLRHYSFTYALAEQLIQLLKPNEVAEPAEEFNPEERFDRRFPVDYYAFSPETDSLDDWQTAWQITQKLILQLRQEVEANGGELMVLLVDVRWQHDPAGFQALREKWDFPDDWDAGHWTPIVRDFLADVGIPTLEPLAALLAYQAETGNEIALRKDGHWTSQGQCVVAVELNNWFSELGIFDENINPRDALVDCAG